MTLPRFIALCGNPKSGKSLAQEILKELYGTAPVDDGAPLREFAMQNLGLTRDQVFTQSGKLETVEILGRQWQVRELLGELGNRYEGMFGKDILPFIAINRADQAKAPSFSFGSVRRDQGRMYQARGGIVIEIVNPGAGPSNYEFDQYDRSIVDYRVMNDGLFRGLPPVEARKDLELKLVAVIAEHCARQAVAA